MIKDTKKRLELDKAGSALIMTVVLTVMLAVIAIVFVAIARMDSAATSNIADNKTLDLAAQSIIDLLEQQLVNDTPGVATLPQEYYDYPGDEDRWLASNEPYYVFSDGGTPSDPADDTYTYYWRQISDITGFLQMHSYPTNDVDTDPPGSEVIKDYPEIKIDSVSGNIQANDSWADADGDGIADSKWFELENIRSSKGGKIYAAVRVIDNSGMVNVNTAHSFDPSRTDPNRINGTTQMQIDLQMGGFLKAGDSVASLHNARCGTPLPPSTLWPNYQTNVIWQYGIQTSPYKPFDISDELELRYRYCIDSKFKSRLERDGTPPVIPNTMAGAGTANFGNLYDGSSNWGLGNWQIRITNPADASADRRHYLTTLNMDRIIAPDGKKMLNINNANVYDFNNLFTRIGLNPDEAAQIAVNIIDYNDSDSDVTVLQDGAKTYYGFETPCIYISELAYKDDGAGNISYAIELVNPYNDQFDSAVWKINGNVLGWTGTEPFWTGADPYYVLSFGLEWNPEIDQAGFQFNAGDVITLTRTVNGADIVVDSVKVPDNGMITTGTHFYVRDITPARCIRRIWNLRDTPDTIGADNNFDGGGDYIQAHPKNAAFTNIGEIGMIFRKPAYYHAGGGDPTGVIGYNNANNTESEVFVDLSQTAYQQIFKYLTVIDPRNFHSTDPNYMDETRVKGRININTAPAFVLAQLPWVSQRINPTYNSLALAQAIVAYRDKTSVPSGDPNYSNRLGTAGFKNIGELCDVCDVNSSTINYGINYYGRDGSDQKGFPDLTTPDPITGDGAPNDFEERDLIFARISDLVTVRSDIFTAYILVRVCTEVRKEWNAVDKKFEDKVYGPQKRYIAIIDRSETTRGNPKVKVRAFSVVPEAR